MDSFKQGNAQVTYWCTCYILIRNNYGTYCMGIIKESSKDVCSRLNDGKTYYVHW